MDFEDLKTEWDKEPDNAVNIPESMEKFKKSNLPIEQVKVMMRKELFMQIIGLVFIGLLPLIPMLPKFETLITDLKLFYLIYSFSVIISLLFIFKFYNFYFFLTDFKANSKDGLYEVYYELKLNLEAYKTWSYTITPLFVIIILQIWNTTSKAINPESIIFDNIYIIGLTSLLCAFYMYWATNWWLNKKYGLHINRLKTILFDLKDDEETYQNSLIIEKESKDYGFFYALITGKGNLMKSFLKMVLMVSIILIAYLLIQWLKNG